MAIPLRASPDTPGVLCKNCCFCRATTRLQTFLSDRKVSQQVPCCSECASRGNPDDVPSNKDWYRRERIAFRVASDYTPLTVEGS